MITTRAPDGANKGAKYAIITVIYKSLGPPDPTQPHLGQLTKVKPVIFLGGLPSLAKLLTRLPCPVQYRGEIIKKYHKPLYHTFTYILNTVANITPFCYS